MDQGRAGDPRIYVVTALFLVCIISGGFLLGLYIFLPPKNVRTWYPAAALILLGIPWIFWFFTYFYRCIRPHNVSLNQQPSKSSVGSPTFDRGASPVSPKSPPPPSIESLLPLPDGASRPPSRGHVEDGVAVTDEKGESQIEYKRVEDSNTRSSDKESVGSSKEHEMPLAHPVYS